MKYELRQMCEQGSGAIVNCSSIGGLTASPTRAIYAVCPGSIKTPMVDDMLAQGWIVMEDMTVFIGSPNWWDTIAPPVATFLSEYDLSGKTIVPFCTHGGGGLGRIGRDIARLCSQSTVLSSFEIYGSGGGSAQARVSAWLSSSKLSTKRS
jgi:hypothetical protein